MDERARTTEPRVAASAVAVAAVSMLWFGIWSVTSDALIGAYLSLASSTGLWAGAVLWLRELAIQPTIAARPPSPGAGE